MSDIQATNNNKNEVVISFNKKTITLCIIALGALLSFIGLFGTTTKFVAHGVTGSSDCNLSYIFKDGWDLMGSLSDCGYKTFNQFILVLLIISFMSATLIACYCIGSVIYFIINKKDFNLNKKLAIFSIATLQYPVISVISNYLYSEYNYVSFKMITADTNVGWGTILVSVGFFIVLLGLIINEYKDKGNLLTLRNIVLKVSIAMFFVICVFASTSLTQVKYSNSFESTITTYKYSSYTLLSFILFGEGGSPMLESLITAKGLAIAAFIMQTLAIVSLFSFAYFAINNVKKYNKIMIAASSAFLFFIILASIFSAVSLGKLSTDADNKASLASGAIITIVLGSLLVLSSFAQLFIKDITIKFAKK